MLGEQLARRGDAVAALRPALSRMLADVQHRLTFRAQTFIKVHFTLVGRPCLGLWATDSRSVDALQLTSERSEVRQRWASSRLLGKRLTSKAASPQGHRI